MTPKLPRLLYICSHPPVLKTKSVALASCDGCATLPPLSHGGHIMSESIQGASPNPDYYYDSPIKPAYMQETFGMRFTNASGAEVRYVSGVGSKKIYSTWEFVGSPDTGYIDSEFYIHPDSLRLLEPKEGDVIFSVDTQKAYLMAG